MRTLLRVGGIAGTLAGALALALVAQAGIAVVALVTLAGPASGLAAAKWLPPAWYGRQFAAGLRAGLVACVIAVPASLIALLDLAPQSTAPLAIGSTSLPSMVSLVGGGTITDALAVAVAALAALVLAAFSARIFANDKSARFVKAVTRAREASQPLHEGGIFAPALARRTAVPLAAVPSGAGALQLDRPTAAPAAASRVPPPRRTLAPATPPDGISGTNGAAASRRTVGPAVHRTVAPALQALPRDAESQPERELETEALPAAPLAPPPAPAPAPAVASAPAPAPPAGAPALKRRGGRPQAARLTPAMIEALAAWARDTEEGDEDADGDRDRDGAVAAGRAGKAGEAAAKREPVESTYLNTPAPAPKRKRKKNATRDWIC